MGSGYRQEIGQKQGLFINARMRQSLQILQFSNTELQEFLANEVEKNPVLEPMDDSDAGIPPPQSKTDDRIPSLPHSNIGPGSQNWTSDSGLDDGVSRIAGTVPPLRERLFEQLILSGCSLEEREIGAHLISGLDGAGRLSILPEKIAAWLHVPVGHVDTVRQRMMRFEPAGLFALSLQECLRVQLEERNRMDPAMAKLLDHLDMLARYDLKGLCQLCEVDLEDMHGMISDLRSLNPKPGMETTDECLTAVIPDILLEQSPASEWILELNPVTTPNVVLNSALITRLSLRAQPKEHAFLSEHLTNANWLIRSLQQRSITILRVATEIIRRQEKFLTQGPSGLVPLTLRMVAESLGVHESTVSRVSANKYIATTRGTLPLKFFFVAALSGENGEMHSNAAIQVKIRQMITNENPASPLSDDIITTRLRKDGIDIARRTVAKYRESIGFPNSVQRRQRAVGSSGFL
ncbi:RNA polymerase factor sigma-54 [Komagataeibacter swingsii]|uniref:RNA polymerase sigma-54 factor n=1 Tax=Komagataeibacter swingsii TaxID=215220 RepID=A0A2V4RIZ9_9PROT|nr:RNA polymerase factor sigma-54 [Komagataeibacter swingsii]PYD68954.1 RNA polymerase sigma-54 factor [Komagataeibacter swingsii]GBQ63702.1 RNA polymerase sigma-54 factor RpoN [Komagataeibacter swingsii DSM 16373]